MNSMAVANTQNLTIAPTQNTAPVFEYRCLYTHDVRRKAKRWQDGFLRLHTFNKRIMVYDVPKNFIGDKHLTQTDRVEDGDELHLDKGVLVQVQELVGQADQDVTEVVAKKRNAEVSSPTANYAPPASLRIRSAVTSSQLRPKSLNALLGISKAPIGRAITQAKSPFERRKQENKSQAHPKTAERPAKRLKTSPASLRSTSLESQHQQNDSRILPRPHGISRKREAPSDSTRTTQSKARQIVDITDEESPPMANGVTPPSRSPFKVPRSVEKLPHPAIPKSRNAVNLVELPESRTLERSPDDIPIPKASRSRPAHSKVTEFAGKDHVAPPRSRTPKQPRVVIPDDSPTTNPMKEKEMTAPPGRPTAAQRRKDAKKQKDAMEQREATELLDAQQERVAERLKKAQRQKNEGRQKGAERRKSLSPPLPTNFLRFAPSKPVRKLWYRDLLPKSKPSPAARTDRSGALEETKRQTREGQARTQVRLDRRRQSATSSAEQLEDQAEQDVVQEAPLASSESSFGVDEPLEPEDGGNPNTTPSRGQTRSQARSVRLNSSRRQLQQDETERLVQSYDSPPHLQHKSPQLPDQMQHSPQQALQIRSSPQRPPQPQNRPTTSNSFPLSNPPNTTTPSVKTDLCGSTSITPLRPKAAPMFPTPSKTTITLLDQQLLAPSRRLSIPAIYAGPEARAAESNVAVTIEVPRSLSPPQLESNVRPQPPQNPVSVDRPFVPPSRPGPVPQSRPQTRRLGLPPGPPAQKPMTRALHPTAEIPHPAPRPQPPPTRTVAMHRSKSNMSNASTTSANDSEDGRGNRISWAGMNPWSEEAWDILGWWPDDRERPAGV